MKLIVWCHIHDLPIFVEDVDGRVTIPRSEVVGLLLSGVIDAHHRAKAATLFHAPRNEVLVDEDGRAGSTEAASQFLVGDSGRAGQARGRDLEPNRKPCRQSRAVRHDDQHVLLALMQVEQE